MSTLNTYNLKSPDSANTNLALDASGNVAIQAGSASAPSVYVTGDANTGLYSPGADQVALTTGGTARLYIDSSGRVGVGNTVPGSFNASFNNLVVGSGSGNEGITVYTGSVDSGFLAFNDAADTSVRGLIEYNHSSDFMGFRTNGSERARIDSSGRLLVGTSTDIGNSSKVQIRDGNLNIYHADSATNAGYGIHFSTDGGATARSKAQISVSQTAGNGGNLLFSTTADGASSPSERMRLASGGNLFAQGVYDVTTASAANVNSASDGGLRRSTSSIKYKQSVETIEDSYSDALLQCRPVWYRSTCKDDCAEHSWWGFIAEEVAEIDPRLVHWKTTEPVVQDDGSLEHVPCDPEPEGVAYERFVPHLLNLIKRQKEQIEEMKVRLTALESA